MTNQAKLFCVLVLATACSRAPAFSGGQTPAVVPPYNSPAIAAWLDCVECTTDQLRAVAALGDRAVPAFRETLLNGPPRDRLDQEQRHLEASHASMKAYERQHPDSRVPFTQQEYVQLYLQKYALLNRMRSARALGAIGTTTAVSALRAAQRLPNLPPELQKEIERAIAAASP